jgi:hypothetical protein
MLGVHRVVLDGGIEPQPVALLAVVEGALERPRPATAAAPPTAPAAAPAWPAPVLVLVTFVLRALVFRLLVVGRLLLGAALGLERRGHERVVLGAQVLLDRVGGRGGGLALGLAGLGRGELVLALESANIGDGDLELMGDPGVRAALADPGPDLVQLWL